MDHDTALEIIRAAVGRARSEPITVAADADLIADDVLDSLDAMTFTLEVEEATGVTFPEDEDLAALGLYHVPTLIEFIRTNAAAAAA